MTPSFRSGPQDAARPLFALACALVIVAPVARAQGTLATCNSSYAWAENALGQSPCDVAAFLHRDCYNDPNYALESLNSPSSMYFNSLNPQPCMCTGAMYVLYSACGSCQAGTGGFTDWNTWMTNCTAPAQGYPETVPSTTQIPAWALIVNATDSMYDPLAAQEAAKSAAAVSSNGSPSSTTPFASLSSTVLLSTSPSSSTSASASASGSPTPASPPPPSDPTPVGAIAGGVIGGVLALALLAGTIFWLRRRRRARADRGDHIHSASPSAMDHEAGAPLGWQPGRNAAPGAPAAAQMAEAPGAVPLVGTMAGALAFTPVRDGKHHATAMASATSIAIPSAVPGASSSQPTTSPQTSAPPVPLKGPPLAPKASTAALLSAARYGYRLSEKPGAPVAPSTVGTSSPGGVAAVDDDAVPPSYESALAQ